MEPKKTKAVLKTKSTMSSMPGPSGPAGPSEPSEKPKIPVAIKGAPSDWITFDPSKQTLKQWLDANKPSEINSNRGKSWIAISKKSFDYNKGDVIGLNISWSEKQLETNITHHDLCDLAKDHGILTGKWLFYADRRQVDGDWNRIATAIVHGQLGNAALYAKVSTNSGREGNYVLNVYNSDFTNKHEVMVLERQLRNLEIDCKLMYKPDVFTQCGIYYKNRWNLRPIIYDSEYNEWDSVAITDYFGENRRRNLWNTPSREFWSSSSSESLDSFSSELSNSPSPVCKRERVEENIWFDPSMGTIEEWLDANKPSQTNKQDGAFWISITSGTLNNDVRVKSEPNGINCQGALKSLIPKAMHISYDEICSLAKDNNMKKGKWMFYVDNANVDAVWRVVATSILNGSLGEIAISAKVSTTESSQNHIVCIYNTDFTNEAEVLALENKIRAVGIINKLMFVPDIYSHFNANGNDWGLQPVTYSSEYDVGLKTSKVESYKQLNFCCIPKSC